MVEEGWVEEDCRDGDDSLTEAFMYILTDWGQNVAMGLCMFESWFMSFLVFLGLLIVNVVLFLFV
jgi:hypothetical protein